MSQLRAPLFERIARSLRLGRWRYFSGYDLEGNRYFELPHPLNPESTKRTVDYRVKREWSEYGSHSIPIQWYTWLRRTREKAPTLAELQTDSLRQQQLKADVADLERSYREERLQVEQQRQRASRLAQPQHAASKEPALDKQPSPQNAMTPQSDKPPHDAIPHKRREGELESPRPRARSRAADTAASQAPPASQSASPQAKQHPADGIQAPSQDSATGSSRPAMPAKDFEPESWKPTSRRR